MSVTQETEPQPHSHSLSEEISDADQLIGNYIAKGSPDGSGRVLLGKVVSYESSTKLFTIFYENRRREVLNHQQVRSFLKIDCKKFSRRKRNLDQLTTIGEANRPNTRSKKNEPIINNPIHIPQSSSTCRLVSEDASDSSSNSCDYEDCNPVLATPLPVQILLLPSSTGDLSIPEELVPYLFSVYNFLRSFSLQLFLSPFSLDDFVGSLNCAVQNSLSDAIHLSLLRALRCHLETLASEDSELASKCLRHCEWSLLDGLTWPVILVGYLYMKGYMKQLEEKEFTIDVSGGEYYGWHVSLKLKVLQILCDDVVDSAKIRTELEKREGSEEVDECCENSRDALETGPKRVHPRYSKTSACKNLEALQSSIESKLPVLKPKTLVSEADASDAAEDGNSDECQLCGMNGKLICCDGCPCAYHSRCIGLNKAHLPKGPWFCPECTINEQGLISSKIGRGTSGAEIFGTDANGRMFLGTCNYLLVVGTSFNSELFARYYNQDDVTNVVSAIFAADNASSYADICRGISKYWEFPLFTVQSGKSEQIWDPLANRGHGICYVPSHDSATGASLSNDVNTVICATNTAAGSPEIWKIMCQKNSDLAKDVNHFVTGSADKADLPDPGTNQMKEEPSGALYAATEKQFAPETSPLTVEKLQVMSVPTSISEQTGNESAVTEMSYDRLLLSETATCDSVSGNVLCKEDAAGFNFSIKKELIGMPNENGLKCHINDGRSGQKSKYPALFKPQAYINVYIQGDIAASAAANLAVLASEESKVSGAHLSSNRKALAASTVLQMKAFTGATFNFFWPVIDKKLMEIPKERCGWCIGCETSSTCKKGCLLNLAAASASKRFAKNFVSLRSTKHFDSHLPIIAAQIAHMGESLRGLMSGPLSSLGKNEQWNKLVRGASSCKVLKLLLLELEKNIRGIAFMGDWTKLVDDWLIEFSPAVSGACRNEISKKRGVGAKRSRKQSGPSESENDSPTDWKNVQWRRRGKLSQVLRQKGALPSSLVKKASRQGGLRRISGVHYPEGSELPRVSHQCAWRTSVEMCKNASQLALQVRYLDSRIRWRDLLRPERSSLDGKGSEFDVMVFRNAAICDKRIADDKTIYALSFASQNHLPVRVTKNILKTEKLEDGNEKLWFSESHVPLYLIKEYEEKVGSSQMPSTMSSSHSFPIMGMRHQKVQGDIFSYLMRKGEEPSSSPCTSCQTDVLLRDACRCSNCQGYCHKDCAVLSIAVDEDDLEFLFTCKVCCAKSAASISNNKRTLHAQSTLKGQDHQLPGSKCMLQKEHCNSAEPTAKIEVPSIESCASASNSSKKIRRRQRVRYGLIWKRKKGDDSGKNFRTQNILRKGMGNIESKAEVICFLCNKPYCSEQMFIRCENCPKWFHADALELEETQIFDLAGFSCFDCRKKPSSKCPYAESDNKRPGLKTVIPVNAEKCNRLGVSTQLISKPKIEEFNDPPLCAFGKIKPTGEQAVKISISARISQQKLCFRRPQITLENGTDEFYATLNANADSLANPLTGSEAFSVEETNLDWDATNACSYGGESYEEIVNPNPNSLTGREAFSVEPNSNRDPTNVCNYGDEGNEEIVNQSHVQLTFSIPEDMEFEPQTYFSFAELMACDDDQADNQYDMSIDAQQNWLDFDNCNRNVLPCDSSAAYEAESTYKFAIPEENFSYEVPCFFCKLSEPFPDLVCVSCSICIHSHCSPWEDYEDTLWRCGNCRTGNN